MRLSNVLFAMTLFPIFAAAQSSTSTTGAAPTVAEARAFMDRVETELLASSNEASRAGWVQATFITDDTEAISAKANERLLTKTNEFVVAARRFDGLQL